MLCIVFPIGIDAFETRRPASAENISIGPGPLFSASGRGAPRGHMDRRSARRTISSSSSLASCVQSHLRIGNSSCPPHSFYVEYACLICVPCSSLECRRRENSQRMMLSQSKPSARIASCTFTRPATRATKSETLGHFSSPMPVGFVQVETTKK